MLRNASTSPNSPRKETFGPLACAVGKSYRTARSRTPNSRTGTRWWLTRLKAEVDLPFRMDAQSLCTLKRQHTPLNPASSVFILIETWMWSRHPCPRPLVSVLQQATSHTIFFFFFLGRGMLTWVRSHLMSLSFRYAILLNCWRHERGERPEFEKLAAQLHAIDLGACAPDYETPSAPPPARPPRSGKWWYTRFSRLCHFSMPFFFLFCRLIDKMKNFFFFGSPKFVIFWLCYGCRDL